jgi:vacuolar-type H+-ATPase subunit I/STV1
MIKELEQRLDVICESLEGQKEEFEEAATLCAQAINGMNQRVERIEKWMENVNQLRKINREKIKAHT